MAGRAKQLPLELINACSNLFQSHIKAIVEGKNPHFLGTPHGNITAHLFNDGTLKTSTMMHQENNRRREQEAGLLVEENKFPHLNQTPLRTQAYNRKMARIRNARDNSTWSIMKKQLEKATAEEEYNRFLQEQAEQRAKAAKK